MTEELGGPSGVVLTAAVARRYYLDGRSKVDIAAEFGLSRFKVARLIELARESGLVRIEIRHSSDLQLDLSVRLKERFGLRHSVVVDTPEDDDALREVLGRTAARLLGEIVTPHDVLGLAWARSVRAMARALPALPGTPVVQLTGALSLPHHADTSVDVVREVAAASGGAAYTFYAPFIVPDPTTARALRRQPEVARAFAQLPHVTKAVAGLGLWAAGQSTLHDALPSDEQAAVAAEGVLAELSGVFLSQTGEPVPTGLADRMIGVSADDLRTVPEVIAIVYGTAKAPAVRAVLSSGLIVGLVTHASLAEALLDASP